MSAIIHRPAWGQKDLDACERIQVKASHAALQIKADPDEPGRIRGYGSVFGEEDSYGEIVDRGAFKKSLREIRRAKKSIKMLWQHDSRIPIGKWDEFEEDDYGLKLGGLINLETQRGKDAWSDVQFGSLDGLSIGYFEIRADAWGQEGPRHLKELSLREVSVVTFPALQEAKLDAVKARLGRGEQLSIREFEEFVRDELNLSNRAARVIASAGYKTWLDRDDQGEAEEEQEALAAMKELRDLLETKED